MPFPERRRQRGNIVAMMMAMVAMMGVAAVAGVNMLSGPITTASKVTNQNMAQNDLLMNAKVVVMNAATRPNGGDEDEDGYIEPAPFVPTSEESCNITLPGEGGCLPMDIGAIQTDPWGTQYAYCVWDHGSVTGSENRIAGEDSTSGAVIAIISAGPNRQFETPCLPYDGDPETNDIGINPDGLGDDLVQIFTYAGAVSGSGGLWELKQGEPTTAVTAKDVEVDGAFRMGFAGEDPGQVGLASCTDMNHIGRMRFNPLDKAIEVCVFNGNYGWETLSGSSDSGAGGTSIIEGWPDAIVCGDGNRWATFHPSYEALNGDVHYLNSWQRQDYDQARSLMLVYSPDKTYKDVLYTAGWGTAVHQECVGKSISQLYADGQAFNFVGGGSGNSSGSTMVPGWPDAIVCEASSGTFANDGGWVLYHTFESKAGGYRAYRSGGNISIDPKYIRLNMSSDGSFLSLREVVTGVSSTAIDGNCANKTISELYADGLAFNFVGGGGGAGGEGDNLGDHTATQNLDLGTHKLVGEGGTDGIYINSDGNVGIGTAAPTNMLHVNGDISAVSLNNISSTQALYLKTLSDTAGPGSVYANSPSGHMFEMAPAASPTTWLRSMPGTASAAAHIQVVSGSGYQNMALNPGGGNVGIGTSSPSQKLQVVGLGHVANFGQGTLEDQYISVRGHIGLYLGMNASLPDSSGSGLIQSGQNKGLGFAVNDPIFGNSSPAMFIDRSSRVGIGTTAPLAMLHIKGPPKNSGYGQIAIQGNAAGSSNVSYVSFRDINDNRTGYVGEGSSGNSDIYVVSDSGNVRAHGTGGACVVNTGGCTSDIRLKQDIQPVEGALAKLMRLSGVSFEWKMHPGEHYMGFIAQEVEKQFPILVKTDEEGTKSVNYNGIVAPIVEAIKELKALLDDLVKQVAELSRHLTALTMSDKSQNERIAELEAENSRLGADLEAANDNFRRELDELRALMAE